MAPAAAAVALRRLGSRVKMAPASPRLASALEHHAYGLPPTSSNRVWMSRFSTASPPPPTNPRGPQTSNKKGPGGNKWDSFIGGVKDTAPKAAYAMVVTGFIYIQFYIIPAMDRMDAQLEAQQAAWVAIREEIKKSHERTRALIHSNKESQAEAEDISEV